MLDALLDVLLDALFLLIGPFFPRRARTEVPRSAWEAESRRPDALQYAAPHGRLFDTAMCRWSRCGGPLSVHHRLSGISEIVRVPPRRRRQAGGHDDRASQRRSRSGVFLDLTREGIAAARCIAEVQAGATRESHRRSMRRICRPPTCRGTRCG